MIPTREQAWNILTKYVESPSLQEHCKTVEGVMRYFAPKFGGDPEIWGVAGLLHDVDYEKWPEAHCKKMIELLDAEGVDREFTLQLAAHGWGLCTDVEPETDMANVLYTVDELTGLIHAAAIMRPSKSVMDLELKSVKKKYKSKGYNKFIAQGREKRRRSSSKRVRAGGMRAGGRRRAPVPRARGSNKSAGSPRYRAERWAPRPESWWYREVMLRP